MSRVSVDLLLVYGRGGHAAQMARAKCMIEQERENLTFAIVRDDGAPQLAEAPTYIVSEVRRKHGNSWVHTLRSWSAGIYVGCRVLMSHRVGAMLSTGPGIAFPVALVMRMAGVPVVHFETWSRFYTRSFTGRAMYRIATAFYVQNEEQLRLYPRAVYRGRL